MADEQQQVEQQTQQNEQPTGADPGEKAETGKTFTQSEVDAIVKERIDRERRKADEATKKATADAEAKALAEQGKYKELYETLVAERDELKPYRERYEAMAAQRRAALVALTAKWPAEVRALLPGDDADVPALEAAVEKASKVVEALTAKADAAKGQTAAPPPAGRAGAGAERDANRAAYAARVRNF